MGFSKKNYPQEPTICHNEIKLLLLLLTELLCLGINFSKGKAFICGQGVILSLYPLHSTWVECYGIILTQSVYRMQQN